MMQSCNPVLVVLTAYVPQGSLSRWHVEYERFRIDSPELASCIIDKRVRQREIGSSPVVVPVHK